MSRRRANDNTVKIISDRGETFVQGPSLSAYFRYKHWLIKVNPVLLFPGFRKDNQKKIYVNGVKYGYAEHRYSCIPLVPYLFEGKDLGTRIQNFMRQRLGVWCKRNEKGYYLVQLGRYKYIVLRRYTKERNMLCTVYYKRTGEQLGSFVFDREFTKIYPRFGSDNLYNTMYVIMGYMADVAIYDSVAHLLDRTIEVVYS